MLISGGGGGCRFGDRYGYMGMFILWGGWGSFATNIGYVNIVGGRGPRAEFGDDNIWGVRVGGLGLISGMLILWGQGRGRGRVGGQKLGMLILGGGGVGDRNGYAHIMWVGCFGTDIGDVNILGGRGALGRDWGC